MSSIHALQEHLNVRNKNNKCTWIEYVLSNIISYQDVSIGFVIIIRVALQEYSEYNKLPNCVSGTTQRYDRFLRFADRASQFIYLSN